MLFTIGFASGAIEKRFEKDLDRIDRVAQERIMSAIEGLSTEPRPPGKKFKLLEPPVAIFSFVAEYRLRVGGWRILYNIDDKAGRIFLIAIRRRSEKTYG